MSKSIKDLVSKNIRSWRIRKGISQEELARVSGHSLRFISRAENQPQNLTIESLDSIARALEIPVFNLLKDQIKNSSKGGKVGLDALDQAIKLLHAHRTLIE